MTMMKCASVGCTNPVAKHGERCSDCKRNDLSYGL